MSIFSKSKEITCNNCGSKCKRGARQPDADTEPGEHKFLLKKEIPATCLTEGQKVFKCSVCGYKRTENIPSLGHSFGKWLLQEEAKCETSGVETRQCIRCGSVENKDVPPTGHKWGKWVTEAAPTCEKDGSEKCQCEKCGKIEKAIINKTGHRFSDWETVKTDSSSEERYCSKCGKREKRKKEVDSTEKNPTKSIINKTGHRFSNLETVKTDSGSEERDCSKTEKRKLISPKRIPKKANAITASVICACVLFIIVLNNVIIPHLKLNKAMNLIESGDYNSAYALLEEIGNSEAISANKYDIAMTMIASGDYKQAYLLLINLNYKDSTEKANELLTEHPDCKFQLASVGDIVTWGTYEQDNNTSNGKEEIEWLVLAIEDNKILVISDKALDCQQYNTTYTSVTWETCTLRTWLNNTFLNAAFTAEEQSQILTTTVSADKNPNYSTNPGNSTTDKVFLFSITEVEKYFSSNEDRRCILTAYAKAQGAYTDSSNMKGGAATCWWWLRSPGSIRNDAAYVSFDGSVGVCGDYVNYGGDCVRPAMWINLES